MKYYTQSNILILPRNLYLYRLCNIFKRTILFDRHLWNLREKDSEETNAC